MIKQPLSARVSSDVLSDAKARAEVENVSLSAIVEASLKEYLKSAPSVPGEATGEVPDCQRALEALEARVSSLEAQQQGGGTRSGRKRRR